MPSNNPNLDSLVFGPPSTEDREELVGWLATGQFKTKLWEWQYSRASDQVFPITAKLSGELVGLNGMMSISLNLSGEPVSAAWSCDFVVVEHMRKFGIGRELKKELDRRAVPLLTLGTSDSAAIVLRKSGWQQGRGPRFFQHVRTGRGVRNRLLKIAQLPMRAMRFLVPRTTGAGLEWRLQEEIPDPESLNRLWNSVAQGYPACVSRDSEYLTWRYSQHPLANYQYLGAYQADSLVALLIIRQHKQTVVLVDYAGPISSLGLKVFLVSSCARMIPKANRYICSTSDTHLKTALLLNGFLPTFSKATRFFFRWPEKETRVPGGDSWFLMSGDSDGEFLAAARTSYWSIEEWSENDFRTNLEDWTELLESSCADKLFLSWEWQFTWWKHFSGRHGLTLRLVAIYNADGRLDGLAPFFSYEIRLKSGLKIRRLATIGNIPGGPATMRSEYQGLILRSGIEPELAKQLGEYFVGEIDWDDMVLQDWEVSAQGAPEFEEALLSCSVAWDETRKEVNQSNIIPLAAGFQSYVNSLSSNARRSLFGRRAYLERLGRVTQEFATDEDLDEYFDDLNRLHAIRWGSEVFVGHRKDFHLDLARRLMEQDRVRISRLLVDDRVVSVLYNLRGGDKEYNLQMGFDDNFHSRKISLGLLHLGYSIESAEAQGIRETDLLAGPGRQGLFKHRIAPRTVTLAQKHYMRSVKARAFMELKYRLKHLLRTIRKSATDRYQRYQTK